MMQNKYGVCEWYLPVSGPSSIALAKKLGLDGIQLADLGGHKAGYPLLDRRVQELYLEQAEHTGVGLYAYHPVSLIREGGMQYPVSSARGEFALDAFRKSVKICQALSIPKIMVASFDTSAFTSEEELKNTLIMLRKYAEICDQSGLRLIYEGFSSIEVLMQIYDALGGKLTFCYDTLNPLKFAFSNPAKDLALLTVDMIDHVHVKDADRSMGNYVPLGEGAGRLEETVARLRGMGYDGWYFLENHYNELPMSKRGIDGIRNDLDYLKSLPG